MSWWWAAARGVGRGCGSRDGMREMGIWVEAVSGRKEHDEAWEGIEYGRRTSGARNNDHVV